MKNKPIALPPELQDQRHAVKNYFWVRQKPSNELAWVRAQALSIDLPRPIVLVNGCFDLLHPGHMKLIFHARDLATPRGTLVCAMDSDRLVREVKGPQRPIMNWHERAAYLNYMPIDKLVEVDSLMEFKELIERLEPDLRVQGEDWKNKPTRFPKLRKAFVGGSGFRTSDIIERIEEFSERGK